MIERFSQIFRQTNTDFFQATNFVTPTKPSMERPKTGPLKSFKGTNSVGISRCYMKFSDLPDLKLLKSLSTCPIFQSSHHFQM
jgi:hypothetical protein